MSKKKIKLIIKTIFILLIISIIFIISVLIVKGNRHYESSILNESFILNFVAGFVALAVAIISIMYSNIEKIREYIIRLDVSKVEKERLDVLLDNIFKELKQDTMLTFIALVICFSFSLIKNIDLPILRYTIRYVTKEEFILSIQLTLCVMTIIAIADIILTLFKIIDNTKYVNVDRK